MERITEVTREAFGALLQLRSLEAAGSAASAATVHNQMREAVKAVLQQAGEEGYSQQDAQDMAYALAALADELALQQSDDFRDHWMGQPLQFVFFQENQAGEGFFKKLQSIRQDPSRADVLRVYYLCLLFGFKGRYQVRGGESELLETLESVQKELLRTRKGGETLSPHGERPAETLVRAKDTVPLLTVAAGALLLAVLSFAGLRLWLHGTRMALEEQLSASVHPPAGQEP